MVQIHFVEKLEVPSEFDSNCVLSSQIAGLADVVEHGVLRPAGRNWPEIVMVQARIQSRVAKFREFAQRAR